MIAPNPASENYLKRDNTGGATVLPTDKTTATQEYLDYFEKERATQQKDNTEKYQLPISYTGTDTTLGQVFDTDRAAAAAELDAIHNLDAQITMAGKTGRMPYADFVNSKIEVEHKKADFQSKWGVNARHSSEWTQKYRQPEGTYDPETQALLNQIPYMKTNDERRAALDKVVPLSKIDWTKALKNVGLKTSSVTNEVINKDGTRSYSKDETVSPADLKNGAYNIAIANDADSWAVKKQYLKDHPNETADEKNPDYLSWVEKQIPVYKNLKVASSRIEKPAPTSETGGYTAQPSKTVYTFGKEGDTERDHWSLINVKKDALPFQTDPKNPDKTISGYPVEILGTRNSKDLQLLIVTPEVLERMGKYDEGTDNYYKIGRQEGQYVPANLARNQSLFKQSTKGKGVHEIVTDHFKGQKNPYSANTTKSVSLTKLKTDYDFGKMTDAEITKFYTDQGIDVTK